jgi:hypothetical protein
VSNGSYPRWLAPLPGEEINPFGILAIFIGKLCENMSSR